VKLLPLVLLVALPGACSWAGGVRHQPAIVVDERRPSFRGVGFGSSSAEVERRLGEGDRSDGFAPAGRLPSDAGVPLGLPNPVGVEHERPELRRYDDSAFLLLQDRVYAMMLTGAAVETSRGVGIGDSIDEVRRRYDDVRCAEVPGGGTYPSCQARIRARRFVFFGGDPIRSVTFFSREPMR